METAIFIHFSIKYALRIFDRIYAGSGIFISYVSSHLRQPRKKVKRPKINRIISKERLYIVETFTQRGDKDRKIVLKIKWARFSPDNGGEF